MSSQLAPNNGNLYLGRGEVYFDRFADGTTNRTGELNLGNVTTFEVSMKDDTKEKYESMTHSSLLYGRASIRRTAEVTITGDEYSLENFALVTIGNQAVISQTGSTVTGETLTTAPIQGCYYPTAKRKISSVTLHDGSSTKTLGTDYTIDAVTGRIYIVPGGSITNSDTLTVDYTYATISLNIVQGGTSPALDGYIRFISDPVKGPNYEVECWHANFVPDGKISFIADDYGNWTLKGLLIADLTNHAAEPYYHIIDRG